MRRLAWLIAATFPVAIVAALAWFGAFTFVNGYLVRGLGRSNADWTAATLWLSGGMLFWYPLFTEISSRLGRRRTVTAGLSAAAASYVALAFVQDPFLIKVALAIMGAAIVAFLVAWTPFVAEAGRDRPGQAIAIAMLVLNVTGSGSLIAGGYIAGSQRYRLMFLVFGTLCAACVIAFHFLAKHIETIVASDADHAGREEPVSMRKLTRPDLAALLGGPFFVVVLLGVFAAPFSFHTSNQLFPNLARDVHGLNETHIAMIVGIGRIPALVTLLAISRVVDRINVVRCYAVGLLCDAAMLAVIACAPSAGPVTAAYLTFYLVHGIVWGAALPAVNACATPRLRDSAFAITGMTEVVAIFLAGLVHNRLIVAGRSLPYVFVFCGAITGLAAAGLFAYSFTRHWRNARAAKQTAP